MLKKIKAMKKISQILFMLSVGIAFLNGCKNQELIQSEYDYVDTLVNTPQPALQPPHSVAYQ